MKLKLNEETEKIVFKQGNRPLNNNMSLVICVSNIVFLKFYSLFSDVRCKNILAAEHPESVLVYTPTRNAYPFPGLFNSTGLWKE